MVGGVVEISPLLVDDQSLRSAGHARPDRVNVVFIVSFSLWQRSLPVAKYPAALESLRRLAVGRAFQVLDHPAHVLRRLFQGQDRNAAAPAAGPFGYNVFGRAGSSLDGGGIGAGPVGGEE